MTSTTSRVLTLPGWMNSDAGHWQTLWDAQRGHTRVMQDDWLWPRRGDWMAQLDDTLLSDARPTVLVAHSLGCQLVAAWAAHSQHTARVVAALLVAPPDTERADMPPNLFNWRPILRQRLPFASQVVISNDDPYCATERALGMAQDWGSSVATIGPRGHINGESGLGDWPEGLALLHTLIASSTAARG